jgi:hypothetical protein
MAGPLPSASCQPLRERASEGCNEKAILPDSANAVRLAISSQLRGVHEPTATLAAIRDMIFFSYKKSTCYLTRPWRSCFDETAHLLPLKRRLT